MARTAKIRKADAAARGGGDDAPDEDDTVWCRIPLTDQATDLFRLARDPFGAPPAGRDEFWRPKELRDLRERALAAPTSRSLVVIVAPSGAGKSTFLKDLFVQDGPASDLRILAPGLADRRKITVQCLYEYMLRELGMPYREVVQLSPTERDRELDARLWGEAERDHRVALLLDDAHDLSDEVLLACKAWIEKSRAYRRLLGVILVGQEELGIRLAQPRFRQIKGRADVLDWPVFGARHVRDYLKKKVELAGGEYEKIFGDDAAAAIARRITGGDHERPITLLAIESCAALALRYAAKEGRRPVAATHVRDAKLTAEDLEEARAAA